MTLQRGLAPLMAMAAFAGAQPAPAEPLVQNLNLQGVAFTVGASGEGSTQRLVVKASEHGMAYPVITEQVDGTVKAVEVEDLNSDGRPELVVIVVGAGSGSYGSVRAWSASTGHTLLPITLSELTTQQAKGYRGHDRFAVVETTLARRFPLYRPGDSNASPTGGMRQIDYKLVAGEAGWLFKPVRTADSPAL